MIGFPKKRSDFKEFLPKTLDKKWLGLFEDQAQFFLNKPQFFEKKMEGWRHFPFQKVLDKNFQFSPYEETPTSLNSSSSKLSSSFFIEIEGEKIKTHFEKEKNIQVFSWRDFLQNSNQIPEKITKKLLQSLKKDRNPFSSLSSSSSQNGWIILIKGKLEKPLEIHYKAPSFKKAQGFNLRNMLFLEKEAEAQVLEVFENKIKKEAWFINAHTDLFLEEKAFLEKVGMDDIGEKDSLISQYFGSLEEKAKAQFFQMSFGGSAAVFLNHLSLKKESSLSLKGASLLKGEKDVEHKVSVKHEAESSKSEQFYKSFLFDSSRQIFHGEIDIKGEAQKSDAKQLSQNFLFGEKSLAVSVPSLNVVADNVKANHGATITPFKENKDMIFYLRSRGIPFSDAVRLLLSSLIKELRINLKGSFKVFLDQMIEEKLKEISQDLKERVP